jgi:hypothetical protein
MLWIEGLTHNCKYSQEESATGGVWIDGKPIYRRTFADNATVKAALTTIGTIDGLDRVIAFDGAYFSSGASAWQKYVSLRPYNAAYRHVEISAAGEVGVYVGNSVYTPAAEGSAYITIYYTKTSGAPL